MEAGAGHAGPGHGTGRARRPEEGAGVRGLWLRREGPGERRCMLCIAQSK